MALTNIYTKAGKPLKVGDSVLLRPPKLISNKPIIIIKPNTNKPPLCF